MTGNEMEKYQNLLKQLPENQFTHTFNAPLCKHSSWRIGGPADLLLQPFNKNCLRMACRILTEQNIPMIVIGKGSNLLFDDSGFQGVVIKLSKLFSNVSVEGDMISAEAGLFLPKLSYIAANNGFTGLEHICGIPGTIGGLVYMNGGSLNRSIGENVCSVEALTLDGKTMHMSNSQCCFSYRKSIFQEMQAVITGVRLTCEKGDTVEITNHMKEILKTRKENFPLAYPSCGSVFKINPSLLKAFGPPGKIIDDAGLKGLCIGGAEVSQKHANFIINTGKATSGDVIRLGAKVRNHIFKITGSYLKSEVQYVHPDGTVVSLDAIL